jgi:hypothetical protein
MAAEIRIVTDTCYVIEINDPVDGWVKTSALFPTEALAQYHIDYNTDLQTMLASLQAAEQTAFDTQFPVIAEE